MKTVRAKKYLGQHFLNNTNIAKKTANLLNKNAKYVIEIGPGMGMLTQFLIQKNFKTKVVEIDNESVSYLNLNYPKLKGNIIHDDFLQIDIKKIYSNPCSLIGNFPYNISSQILFKTFENRNQITELIGMFQKEVGERITSKKGKNRGILSVLIQTFYNTEYCFTVDEHLFSPIPKVKTGVIRLIRNKRKDLACDEKLFKQIVKAGFNQRRKTLRNALKSFSLEKRIGSKQLLQKRAEELSVEDFITITLLCQKKLK